MEVNGAVPALAGTVTFTGIGSIALLGSFFLFFDQTLSEVAGDRFVCDRKTDNHRKQQKAFD